MSIDVIDALSVVVLILGWRLALSVYSRLPERVPVNFGLTGEADRWGGRWTIFLIPFEMRAQLHLLLLELSVIFAYITWRMSEVAFGRARGLGGWFLPVAMIAVFATCGWMWVLGRGH